MPVFALPRNTHKSQSLWSRDGFSIKVFAVLEIGGLVAIPLEQGRFFNTRLRSTVVILKSRNPFGAGTVF